YRLESAAEVEELGFSEALAGIALVEWPERLGALLPADALHVTLSFTKSGVKTGEGGRLARLEGGGDWPQRLAELTI
ncbi:MAG TPA: tRNA (adenosine(37)-N6)-threonylcarbamoyltransferase complex ATPase subunit type 1 TsaE, partial [Kiloniellaceae bacterium]